MLYSWERVPLTLLITDWQQNMKCGGHLTSSSDIIRSTFRLPSHGNVCVYAQSAFSKKYSVHTMAAIIWGWDKPPPPFKMISLDPPHFYYAESPWIGLSTRHSLSSAVSVLHYQIHSTCLLRECPNQWNSVPCFHCYFVPRQILT